MSEAAQQSLDQWLPVPLKIWTALKVSPVENMVRFWADLPLEIRQQWMALAKCQQYDMTPGWMAITEEDRIKILRVMHKVRSIYVGSDLATNWRHVAAMGS